MAILDAKGKPADLREAGVRKRERARRADSPRAERNLKSVQSEFTPPTVPPPAGQWKLAKAMEAHTGLSEFNESRRAKSLWLPKALVNGALGWAEQEVVRTTGVTELQMNELKLAAGQNGRGTQFQERARVLMGEGIITTGVTLPKIVERAKTRASEHSKHIRILVQEVDRYIADHPKMKAKLPSGARIAARIRKELIGKLSRPADAEIIDRLERDAESIAAQSLTFASAQKLKASYDKYLYGEAPLEGPLREELWKLRRIVSDEIDLKAETMLQQIDPEKCGQLKDAKMKYWHLSATQEIAHTALVSRETTRNTDTSMRLSQWAAAGVAAGLGWLLGILFQLDPHTTAAVSGAAGTAQVATKAISHYMGGITPSTAAPWVYSALVKKPAK
jgi:ElaB/YqjD/DUF883 family membrane-anchored ribosome-binding protein